MRVLFSQQITTMNVTATANVVFKTACNMTLAFARTFALICKRSHRLVIGVSFLCISKDFLHKLHIVETKILAVATCREKNCLL